MASNFERMLALVDEVFSTRTDPNQLQVNENVIEKLQALHPATLSEHNVNGPVVWILLIPTTTELMEKFLFNEISEQELFDETVLIPDKKVFNAIYLCSASVLPEYRKKGLGLKMTVEAINAMRKDFDVKTLFVWAFSKEGEMLAKKVAEVCGIEIKFKT